MSTMQKLSGLRSFKEFRFLIESASTAMKATNPKPSSDAGGSSFRSFANLKITAEKLVKEQASVKTVLKTARTKLRRATEQINLFEGKLQQALNGNAKLKVKQTENSKLWQGLDSEVSSTKTLCDQLTETLQQLASKREQAEKNKKFFEEMLGKNSIALVEFNFLLHDLSAKLECVEQNIISGKQEMLQILQDKEEMDRSYKKNLFSASNINRLEKLASELGERIQKLLVDSTLAENHKQEFLKKILKLETDNQELLGRVQSIMDEKSNDAESPRGEITKCDQEVNKLENQINLLLSALDEKEQLYNCSVERKQTLEDQKLQVEASLTAAECQLRAVKKHYYLILEGKQIELSKHLKDLSLKNDQVINEICKKNELEKIDITNAEKEKAQKLIWEMENKCNQKILENKQDLKRYLMHLKEKHGAMVARIQQDNEHKESTLWTYQKEELQATHSEPENELREMLSLLPKEHKLEIKSLGMHHDKDCQRMQEELDLQEENQRKLLQLQWKVMGENQQVNQRVNSKKDVNFSGILQSPISNMLRKALRIFPNKERGRSSSINDNSPGNTATIYLDAEDWSKSKSSYIQAILKVRQWCRANSLHIDLSDFWGEGTEIFTTPKEGTFHLSFEYKNRRITLFLHGSNLYLKGWNSDRFGMFEMHKGDSKPRYIMDAACKILRMGENYNHIVAHRDISNVRIGPLPMMEGFEVLHKCISVSEELFRAIAVFAVNTSEAIRVECIFEEVCKSYDCYDVTRLGQFLGLLARRYGYYSRQYLEHVDLMLRGLPTREIENRPRICFRSASELTIIKVPLRSAYTEGIFANEQPKQEVWCPPYPDGMNWIQKH